jgi:hypothetical protein
VRLRKTTALLLALAAAAIAGCGSDDEQGGPIPQQAAADLQSRLDEVERRMDAGGGACADIANDSAPAVSSIVESLPQKVDPDVRQALQDGFDRLFTLTGEQCDVDKGQETEQEPEPPPQTETETVPQTETETVPTVPETTPETTPTTPEEPPIEPTVPDEGGDDGDGGAAVPEGQG